MVGSPSSNLLVTSKAQLLLPIVTPIQCHQVWTGGLQRFGFKFLPGQKKDPGHGTTGGQLAGMHRKLPTRVPGYPRYFSWISDAVSATPARAFHRLSAGLSAKFRTHPEPYEVFQVLTDTGHRNELREREDC
eukprot:1833686-Rhodomonas_salina.1